MKRRALAALALIAVAAASAQAQSLTHQATRLVVPAGGTLQVPVYLQSAGTAVAGVNFTVRVSAAQGSAILLDQTTSATTLAGFQIVQRAGFSRTGVASGLITGSVLEYRGIVIPSGQSVATFNPQNTPKVATISVPIASNASGTYTLELVSGTDTGVGLAGTSTAAGVSASPTGGLIEVRVVSPTQYTDGDYNGDGCVDLADLQYVLDNWGITTASSDYDKVNAHWQQGCQ